MRRWGATIVLIAGLLLSACGGGGSETGSDAATSSTSSDAATSTTTDDSGYTADQAAVLAVTRQYLQGIADKDWEAVCDARTEKEQAALARQLQSCEAAVQVIYDSKQFENFGETYATLEPKSITVTGDHAVVDYGDKDDFLAMLDNGEWKLYEE